MPVFVCTDHDYHYPVGVASVIVANDEAKARELLDEALRGRGLFGHDRKPYTLRPINLLSAGALILNDGNY